MIAGLTALALAAAPAADGPELTFDDYDRATVRVLNVGLPACGTDDLLCAPAFSHGSGFMFQRRGTLYVATNAHVVDRAQVIAVVSRLLSEPVLATVLVSDARRDVVLLKLQAEGVHVNPAEIPTWSDLQWLELSDDVDYVTHPELSRGQLVKGDPVVSLGFPLDPGQTDAERRDGRFTRWYRDDARGRWLLQVDIDFLPGTSGGPLLTSRGDIAGMIIYRTSMGGAGLAIPAQGVRSTIAEGLKLKPSAEPPAAALPHRPLAAGIMHLQQANHLLRFKFPARSSLRACAKREDRTAVCDVLESAREHLKTARQAFSDLPRGTEPPVQVRLLDVWAQWRLLLLERYEPDPFSNFEGRDEVLQDLNGVSEDLPARAAALRKALPKRHASLGFLEALANL
jgi:hypothetical protein